VVATAGIANLEIPAIPLDWTKIWVAVGIAGIFFAALFFTTFEGLAGRWAADASWSHGFVVPLIALFFVYNKWELLKQLPLKGAGMGMIILMAGVFGQVLFRATGTLHMSNLSIVVTLYGLVLFVFGWNHLRILWLPISFLVFMLPPPNALYVAATTPMQFIAAELGVRFCPLFGITAMRDGTIIRVLAAGRWEELQVAEACSGMRMLVAFFALAVALAYSTNRPVWEKVFLAACALPIAILCNSLRVTFTAALVVWGGPEWAHGKTHEYVGLLMLIPALILQMAVGWVLDRIFVEQPADEFHGTPPGSALAPGGGE